MKRQICIILAASLTLAGCDENARKFALESKQLLDEYRKKLTAEIAESNGYYRRNAALQVNASWRRLNDGLGAVQEERSTALAADYEDGSKSPSRLRGELRDYALLEAEQRRQSQAAGVDATLPYMQRVAQLEADKQKVEALSKMLEVLATPRSLSEERKELEQFVNDTKTSFAALVCKDLLDKQKRVTGAEKDAIDQLVTDKNCN